MTTTERSNVIGHGYWWNDTGWARCECGEYLCVVGRSIDPIAATVADGALVTHVGAVPLLPPEVSPS